MSIFKRMTGVLVSLQTAILLVILLIAMLLAGAFVMPANTEFQSVHDLPLLRWMLDQPLKMTWWLWASIGITSATVFNTLFCSIESLFRKRAATQWLLLISPQIIHLGFLLILLAHLLSAFGGYRELVVASRGSLLQISEDTLVRIHDIKTRVVTGYIQDWSVELEYYHGETMDHRDSILPNKPSLGPGFNLTVKDIRAFPVKKVLLQVSREPGALWALSGGVLFVAGITILIFLKVKSERD